MKAKTQRRGGLSCLLGVFALLLTLAVGLIPQGTALTAKAESAAKITAASAKIRENPNTSSTVIGSAEKNKVISVKSQTTGSDGYTWYEVYVDATTTGYIRADLVSITDGTTPPTSTATDPSAATATTTTTTTTATEETPVEVTAVNPVSASVSGGASVRIRSNASTTSSIVTTVENGMALTVTGTATGTDGKSWYQVSFTSNSVEVTGFVRSDFVTLSGELTQYTEEVVTEEPEATEEPVVVESKTWETAYQNDTWYLQNLDEQVQYKIDDLFATVNQIDTLVAQNAEQTSTLKTQKVVIIILVVLIVVLGGGLAFVLLRMRDEKESAYMEEVERDTLSKRNVDRPRTRASDNGQGRPAGIQRRPAGNGQGRAAGAQGRPTGAGQGRPAGNGQGRAAGNAQARPAAESQMRAAGSAQTRPAAEGQTRVAGSTQGRSVNPQTRSAAGSQGRVVAGTQARAVANAQGRVAASAQEMADAYPAGRVARQSGGNPRPAQSAQRAADSGAEQAPAWKSRNFMADDDEFEFEFLNMDSGDES